MCGYLIYNDTIVVYLSNLIQISQIVEANLIVMRNVEVFNFATYTRPNIC